jgi:3'-phosphoadenosine 5'-phosphosulfate (PAPS) 3'-phosphatase
VKCIRALGLSFKTKHDESPVDIADKKNERLIREAIELEFPDDGSLPPS